MHTTHKNRLAATFVALTLTTGTALAQGFGFDGGDFSLDYTIIDRDPLGDTKSVPGASARAAFSLGSSFGMQASASHRDYGVVGFTQLALHGYYMGQNGLKLGGFAEHISNDVNSFSANVYGISAMGNASENLHLQGQIGFYDEDGEKFNFAEAGGAYAFSDNFEGTVNLGYYDFQPSLKLTDLTLGVSYHLDNLPLSLSAGVGMTHVSSGGLSETLPKAELGLTYRFGGSQNVRERERLFDNSRVIDTYASIVTP